MSDEAAARRSQRMEPALLAAVLVPALLAVLLATIDLSGRSLWIDESATFAISSQHGKALLAAMRRDGGNMLAFYALEHLLLVWFGRGAVVMRLPAALASGLTAGAVAEIGRRLFGPARGFAAGLLTAVSLPLVYWAQDARGYSLMFGFAALSYLGFVALIEGESRRRRGRPPRWAWPVYAGGLVCALYMSFVAVLVVPAQLLALALRRRRLAHVASALGVALLCSLPLLVLARSRGAAQLFWVTRPGAASTGEVAEAVTSSGLPPLFHESALTLPLLVITLVLAVLAAVAGWPRGAGPDARSRRLFAIALVAGWAVVPAVLDGIESMVGQSLFEPRYLLISAPAFSLALSCALFSVHRPRWLCWGALVVLVAARLVVLAPSYGVSPENWRAATQFVLRNDGRSGCVAFYPEDGRQAVDYYVVTTNARDLPRPILPSTPWREVRPYVERYVSLPARSLATLPSGCPVLFLVSSHAGSATGTAVSRAVRHRLVVLVRTLTERYPTSEERHFGYAAAVRVWRFSR